MIFRIFSEGFPSESGFPELLILSFGLAPHASDVHDSELPGLWQRFHGRLAVLPEVWPQTRRGASTRLFAS